MADGFKRHLTYILYSEKYGHWYMVHQVSVKSWIATNFTNLDIKPELYQFRSNGVDLWKKLEPRLSDYKVATENDSFRKYMFNVLKYGRTDE